MIGVDWGTSSFRAFRLAGDGTVKSMSAGPSDAGRHHSPLESIKTT